MDIWRRTTPRVINDVLHDLAAGTWPGAVFALWILRSGARGALTPEALALTLKTWSGIYLILAIALATLVATGAGRLTYRGYGVKPALLASRGRTALIKHACFATVIVLVTVAAFFLLAP